MFMQIISRTPPWVCALFVGLLALGLSQMRSRTASLARVIVLPVVMFSLAISGVVSAFGQGGLGLLALAVWAKSVLIAALWAKSHAEGDATRYDPALKQFALPGSVVPLIVIMGIFCTKYAVGVTLALHPELARTAVFALGISGLYGAFSGVFVGKAWRLWQLASLRATLAASA